MKYEAMKHQGSKGEKYTADAIGEAAGDSGRTVQRYIRLSELAEELLGYVNENKIPMMVGEKLSYLKAEEQAWVVDAIGNSGIFPSKAQAELWKESSEAGELTEGKVYEVLVRKEKENVNVTISAKKIRNYFPVEYSKEQIEDVISEGFCQPCGRHRGATLPYGRCPTPCVLCRQAHSKERSAPVRKVWTSHLEGG